MVGVFRREFSMIVVCVFGWCCFFVVVIGVVGVCVLFVVCVLMFLFIFDYYMFLCGDV